MKLISLSFAAFLSPKSRRHSAISSSRNLFQHPQIDYAVTINSIVDETSTSGASTTKSINIDNGIREWLVPSAVAAEAPSPDDIELLQEAMALFYGKDMVGTGRDYGKAEPLLSKAIEKWQKQPADEKAALYRVRADCYMGLLRPNEAFKDYTTTIQLLEGPGGDLADPTELPAAYLGRGRSIRSLGSGATSDQSLKAAKDYETSLRLSAREEWDTDKERIEDGASRNPFAAWEWGCELRNAGLYKAASEAHALASFSFTDIGDRARSVISEIDAGIDLAATGSSSTKDVQETKSVLEDAIKRTTSVEGRDVELLQRVISKEGEGRMALASVLWNNGDKNGAEAQLGEACVRLEQLQNDAQDRFSSAAKSKKTVAGSTTDALPIVEKLKFSIDDTVSGAFDISCSRFKNEKFLSDTLQWPKNLQQMVMKLEKLEK